jgi:hypothetical protein
MDCYVGRLRCDGCISGYGDECGRRWEGVQARLVRLYIRPVYLSRQVPMPMVVRIGDRKPLTSKLMGRKGEGRLNIGAEREARPSLWSLERSAGADEVARLKWAGSNEMSRPGTRKQRAFCRGGLGVTLGNGREGTGTSGRKNPGTVL